VVDGGRVKVDGLDVYHFVAKIERRDVSLCDFEIGDWFWPRLRAAFPLALAASLMPDHPHVVTPSADPERGRMRLNRLLGHLARRVGVRYVGEAAVPTRIADRSKLLRDLRYVDLNAPRERLADDPLSWWFSTHRDVVGATMDPWVDAPRLARALGRPPGGFAAWYHRYVSSDPSVHVAGTPMPTPAMPSDIPRFPLAAIAKAAAAATRTRPDAIRQTSLTRHVFVALAREQGWPSWDALASACACSTRAIRRSAEHTIELSAARLCLGDARLIRAVPAWRDAA
jgi:hypothetical protein